MPALSRSGLKISTVKYLPANRPTSKGGSVPSD